MIMFVASEHAYSVLKFEFKFKIKSYKTLSMLAHDAYAM